MIEIGTGGFADPKFDTQPDVGATDVVFPRVLAATVTGAFTEVVRGPFFIGGRGMGIGVHFKSNDNRAKLSLQFIDDTKLNVLMRHDVVINPLGIYDGIIQATGQNLIVKVQCGGGFASVNYDLFVWMTPDVGTPLLNEGDSILLAVNGAAVGAGANVVTETLRTFSGPANWIENQVAGTYTCNLAIRNLGGGFTTFASIPYQALTNHQTVIYLPGNPLRHQHVNTSAGASTFNAYIIANFARQG